MAISVNWSTKIITVPKADMTLIQPSPEIRELDIDVFRLALKDLEDGDGMPFLDTHSHNTTATIGGVTLSRVVEIINGYTVTFEDDQYAVNLVGANSNISDVANVNQVSIRSANSAGLIQVSSGSGLSAAQATQLDEVHKELNLDSGSPITRTKSGSTITETGAGFTVTHTGADTDTVVSTRT